ENVLHHQTASFIHCDACPSSSHCIVDIGHDCRRSIRPTDFKHLLPNMTSIPMHNRLPDPPKHLSHDLCFTFLFHIVQCLLNNMAPEWVTGQGQDVAAHGLRKSRDLK